MLERAELSLAQRPEAAEAVMPPQSLLYYIDIGMHIVIDIDIGIGIDIVWVFAQRLLALVVCAV